MHNVDNPQIRSYAQVKSQCRAARVGAYGPLIHSIFPLKECELFKDLEDEELARVAIICSEMDIAEGAPLFSEGQPAQQIYIVTQGKIALQKSVGQSYWQSSRGSATVAFCHQDEIVGWSALVEPYRYTLSATAWEPCQLLGISARLLRTAMDLNPAIGYRVMRCLSQLMGRRLQQVTQSLTTVRDGNGAERLRF